QLEQLKLDSARELQSRIAGVQSAAAAKDSQWARIEQQGGPDRQLILNVKSLEKYRDVWRNLLTDIHGAIMSANPQPQLLSGDPAQIKAIPRAQRRQIFVESINTTYMSDLSRLLAASETEFKNLAGSATGRDASSWGGGPQ